MVVQALHDGGDETVAGASLQHAVARQWGVSTFVRNRLESFVRDQSQEPFLPQMEKADDVESTGRRAPLLDIV